MIRPSVVRPLAALGVLAAFGLDPSPAAAQAPTATAPTRADVADDVRRFTVGQNVAVRLRDGSTVFGRVERHDADSLVITGSVGLLALAQRDVVDVRPAGTPRRKSDGRIEYWFPNPNTTRLLFGPTGRTLGAGEGYVADHYVVIGSVAYGFTDRLMLGGGTLLIPSSDLWFVTPKIGLVRGETFNLSVGALYGQVRDESGGIAFAAGTFGGTDRSLTLGVGNGFARGRFAGQQVYMLGGEARVSRRFSLITENYALTGESTPLVSYGVRILGERLSVDLAFWNVGSDKAVFPGIPYVDFVIRF